MLEIADDGTNDWITNKFGEKVQYTEAINRSRLRVDTRKWIIGRINPAKYGDKLDVAHTGTIENSGEHDLAMIARKVAFAFRIMAESDKPKAIED